MLEKTKILGKKELSEKINRLAWEVYEKNYNESEIIMVGLGKRGEELSKRISQVIINISEIKLIHATINMDKKNPLSSEIDISIDLSSCAGKTVVLVDDVLSSGRTLIYAVRKLLSVPITKLSTLVLVDRDHNCYPIKADHVGLSLSTTLQDHVNVVFGKQEGVYLS